MNILDKALLLTVLEYQIERILKIKPYKQVLKSKEVKRQNILNLTVIKHFKKSQMDFKAHMGNVISKLEYE